MKDLVLFDVDGTLTESRKIISKDMAIILKKLSDKHNLDIGFVGGSDLKKQQEQLGLDIDLLKYWFTENGLVAYKDGELFHKNSFVDFLGKEKYQELVNFVLEEFSRLKIPSKTGNFLELRSGLLNICPVGRSCSNKERAEFAEFDNKFKIREALCEKLREKFRSWDLKFVIGGEISIDIFPSKWDKTYCLKFVEGDYNNIYFLGDKCFEGGNDYEIFNHERTISFKVFSYRDTINIISEMFLKN